ncbi:MAG: type I-C CRISPR-associated protein Cas8c/Csd1 [Bacteroidetes bacterium]|nr:type I-C CRISPR-associated protein Cas8c/Csd1 [Bacteroidota bacterium]
MILQALYEYYQRKLEQNQIAPDGFIEKEIDFIVVIDNNGEFVDIENHQRTEGNRVFGTTYYVPDIGKQSEKHSNAGDDANLLWDKSEFVFGIGKKGKIKLKSFVETIKHFYPSPPKDVEAVLKFYKLEQKRDKPFKKILEHKEVGKIITTGSPIVTFRIQGDKFPIACKNHARKAAESALNSGSDLGTCLLTGANNVPLERTHKVIKGIRDAKSSGANLISFNDSAYLSYGKEQSLNAPVCKLSASRYTKALQSLVNSNDNKVYIGDATIVFWAEKRKAKQLYDFESVFPWYLTDDKDNPDRNIEAVKSLYEAINTGKLTQSSERFYVLALAPNASRISIRFFRQGTIRDFGVNIFKHFEDFKIIHGPKEPEHLSLYRILTSTALDYKMENVPPNLASAVFESILDGTPYPMTLLYQCIRRIRAKRDVTHARASILKATINRFNRIYKPYEKEIAMALDSSNTNLGYLLGRLFAVLEKIQEEAQPGINTTIRDRFYGAASTNPIAVFSQLLKLKNHHLAKLENPGRRVNFEKLIGEILWNITIFPNHLTMNDQAYFAIGYYHQRQDFFISKKGNSE